MSKLLQKMIANLANLLCLSRAHYAVLTKALGITKAFCVIGFSMGGAMVSKSPAKYHTSNSVSFSKRRTTGR